jgi:hypothetical protein
MTIKDSVPSFRDELNQLKIIIIMLDNPTLIMNLI